MTAKASRPFILTSQKLKGKQKRDEIGKEKHSDTKYPLPRFKAGVSFSDLSRAMQLDLVGLNGRRKKIGTDFSPGFHSQENSLGKKEVVWESFLNDGC